MLAPDLADPHGPRWMAFRAAALEAGARAVFGFPLQVGAVRLGALNLYRDRPGPLSDDQYIDAQALAGVAARSLLAMQSLALPGALAAELQHEGNFRLVVHQASGMVATQLGIGVGEALLRLRAFAFGDNRSLDEVAEAVVGRQLRFDPPPTPPHGSEHPE